MHLTPPKSPTLSDPTTFCPSLSSSSSSSSCPSTPLPPTAKTKTSFRPLSTSTSKTRSKMVLSGNGRRSGRGLLTRLFRPSVVGLLTMLRNRVFLLFLLLLVFFSSLLLMTSNGPQRARFHLNSLVAETQHQIVDNIKRNFEQESKERKELLGDVDAKYLDELGLGKSSTASMEAGLWPNSSWHLANNASEPVILSAVQNGHAGEAVNFVRNAQLVLPETTIILYNLGISGHELKLVESYCNSSNCFLKTLDTSKFPGHVRNLKTNAYRSIIIQETLKNAGCVLWMDIDQRFSTENLTSYLNQARKGGVLTWTMEENLLKVPTSSRTHPKMFAKLGVKPVDLENYNFQHMVAAQALLIYNIPQVHDKLMLPWVKCVLVEDCLEPIGAQSSGCRYDKKPQYRYSGCHDYDISALNIVLGQMFNFDESRYVAEDRFFVQMSEEQQSLGEDGEDNEGENTADEASGGVLSITQQNRNSARFNRGIFWN